MTDNISTLGFNGEFLDSTLDNYHLGNGYRAYNPNIMAFTAPDDMSPFGSGGINPYVYVSGDPINNTDPSGHFAGFLGAIIGIINMVSPLQVPTSLSVAGVEEAVMGTVVNVGVDLATDGLGAVATPVLRTVEGVARSTADDVIENVGQHAIISGTPTSHDTRYMDKLLNWVYEKPENQRDYYSWLHDTTHQIDAPRAIKSKNEEDFTHLITHNPDKGIVSQRKLERARASLRRAATEGRALHEGNNLFIAFKLTDFEGAKSATDIQRNTVPFTNLKRYAPTPEHLDHFLKTTNDRVFRENNRITRDRSGRGVQYKPRSLYEGYLFYSVSK